jgi:hypothetical protein
VAPADLGQLTIRGRRARFRLVACLLLGAGLALMAIGAPQVAIDLQLVLAITCAMLSLQVRNY